MSYDLHTMPRTLRSQGEGMSENFRAADVTRKILMCQVNDSHDDARVERLIKQPTNARGKAGCHPPVEVLDSNLLPTKSLHRLTGSINSR